MASRGKPRGEGGGGEGWDDPWDQLGAGSSWQDGWPELPGELPPPLPPATAMPGQGLPAAEPVPTVNVEPLGPPLVREPLERSPAQAPGQAAQKSGESAEPTAPPPPRYAPTALRSVFVSSSWPRAAVAAPAVAVQPVAAALGSAPPVPPPVEPVPPEAPPAPEPPVEAGEDDSRLLKPRFRKGSLRGAFQRE